MNDSTLWLEKIDGFVISGALMEIVKDNNIFYLPIDNTLSGCYSYLDISQYNINIHE